MIKKAILKTWNCGTYTATIQIAGSSKTYLEGIKAARNLPTSEMVPGRQVALILWDEHNPSDGVIIAVYT
jgi:hypothetical protein